VRNAARPNDTLTDFVITFIETLRKEKYALRLHARRLAATQCKTNLADALQIGMHFLYSSAMLVLSHISPLAIGHMRRVYQHPENPDLVIKLMRPDVIDARTNTRRLWYKRLRRARHLVGHVRELNEYIATQVVAETRNAPIARMVGLIDTDLGLGLVSEKVREPNGALARTLAAVYVSENGFSVFLETHLETFFQALLACNVIVGDMHAWNVVYGTDSRGGPGFVLIDGFGEKHVIPMASMSRHYNARNTRRLYRRMRAQLVELLPLENNPFEMP